MIQNLIIVILILLIILIIGYIFGVTIIDMINKKIDNISIDIKYPNEYEYFNNYEKRENNKEQTDNKKRELDNDYNEQMNKNNKVGGFSNNEPPSYKNWEIETKKIDVCIKNHKHSRNRGDINCKYGLTNYADPHDMSPIDIKLFTLNYPPNMTLQDYINWLYCFSDKEDELPYNHLKNLEKLKNGIELIKEEGVLPPPGYTYGSSNTEAYFNKMYNEMNEFNTAPPLNSNTGPMIGYNYNEYSEFSQNADLYGSTGTLRNPDIGKKKDAKKFHDYINPKDSNSLNIDKKNEIYRIKKVEV